MHPHLPRLRHLLLAASAPVLAAAALLALGVARVAAGPEGGTVVGGGATIQGRGDARTELGLTAAIKTMFLGLLVPTADDSLETALFAELLGSSVWAKGE
jgi:hypothetical protein